MLDIKFIKENKDIVSLAIKNKKGDPVDLDELLDLYERRNSLIKKRDEINKLKNEAAKQRDIEKGKQLKQEGQKIEDELAEITKKFIKLMSLIPNIPSVDTPVGEDENDNVVLRTWGEKPNFSFKPKPHWELGEELWTIDKKRAAKIAGSRFTYLLGDVALLQFALIQFVISTLTDQVLLEEIAKEANVNVKITPFIPNVPPAMVKPEILNAMGRLDPPEDKYYLEKDNLYLVGSAEHSIGSMFADEILNEKDLPLRFIGYSPAFRREAGSYGKDTKGILRMHQFDKLEMETFVVPGQGFAEQDFLVAIQEYFMQQLGLPYQVVSVCTGDMGFPDQRQIDIETWMPGQNTYRETHSADFVGSFQPRRLNTRVRKADGKTEFLHMNDATAIAIGRVIIAIMENYQNEDGTINVPEVLQPLMGGRKTILPTKQAYASA